MVLKRKISAHAVCINPKNMSGPKKPPTKADLSAELKLTKDDLKLNKELNDALLEEVKHNEEAIEILEGKEKFGGKGQKPEKGDILQSKR